MSYASAIVLLAVVAVPAIVRGHNSGFRPTFNRDIAPIVWKQCAPCHRPGEAGPFSLLTYGDVRSHARQIVGVTQSRYMPPWLPEPNKMHFAGEARLTDAEISTIAGWVKNGAPEGRSEDLPARPNFVSGWQLGKPDLILHAGRPFTLPASGTDVYWNFVLPVPVKETRWVKAVEIRPGDKRLVHHANIVMDHSGSAREMEREPGAGFGGMELRIASENFDPDSHLLFWKPGTVPASEPEGMPVKVDGGTDLVLNVHLQPSGKPESIQPSIGLYFTDQPATLHPMLLELQHDSALRIPAAADHFVVDDDFTLPISVELLAIYPHAHYLGRDMLATATEPDGRTQDLIHIKRWDLNWQAVYRYAAPVNLPKGSVIRMRYVYDNSTANLANPNQPPKLVIGGNGSKDEMAHLWLQVLPHSETNGTDPRIILQEALSRHQVERDPGDFEAQFNLGAMLRVRGETSEALTHFSAAAQIRPKDPVVNNAWGGALLAAGELPKAAEKFAIAIAARPNYFDAHYNLGITLASAGRFEAAAKEFREAVRLNSDDGNAHANLGSALAQLGDLKAAKPEFETALKLQPHNQIARENLDALLKLLGAPK